MFYLNVLKLNILCIAVFRNHYQKKFSDFHKNTANFFEDLEVEDYLNLSYKFYDSFIFIFIFCFFYFYNIKKYKFDIKNILIFILTSTTILIFNQIIKNVNASLIFYIIFTFSYLFFFLTFFYYIQFKTSE